MKRARSLCRRAALVAPLVVMTGAALAQPAPSGPPPAPRDAAPFDMTGYWVSIVNEDWRWRMVTPPKGDYTSLAMLNAAGRAAADQWDPAQDGSCKAYGAAALLRMPTRLRVTWESDTVLKLETDAGEQTRLLRFAAAAAPGAAAAPADRAGPPTLQGDSVAEWERPLPPARVLGSAPAARAVVGGSLKVVTTNLLPGWLRRNGVPYSERTRVTEHFDRFAAPNGDEWLVVTTVVEDPAYLSGRYVTSSHFKRERSGAGWDPQPCRND
jgi:hypothetical protein